MDLRHGQRMVKVNVPVDEGIAPVVVALAEIPSVVTVDSCERDQQDQAYVLFAYGESWRDLGSLLADLSPRIRREVPNLNFTLAMEWVAGGAEPLARISTHWRTVHELADALRASYERP